MFYHKAKSKLGKHELGFHSLLSGIVVLKEARWLSLAMVVADHNILKNVVSW
jgi:hypothetical protein